ncbi:MAG TPA: Lrp/AsnC ligand binding domain-containing protein [Candidatus Bilamarchaeum sp.]|nr:Lrp/AsnC ligand binding domain-containing protein [Candidatus Bilamarchaeum sp.]
MKAFVGITGTDEKQVSAVAGRLASIEGVDEAIELAGPLDLMLRVSSDSASGMSRIMERIKATEGVMSATSYLVIGESK